MGWFLGKAGIQSFEDIWVAGLETATLGECNKNKGKIPAAFFQDHHEAQ
jgi:hypothetical protein